MVLCTTNEELEIYASWLAHPCTQAFKQDLYEQKATLEYQILNSNLHKKPEFDRVLVGLFIGKEIIEQTIDNLFTLNKGDIDG